MEPFTPQAQNNFGMEGLFPNLAILCLKKKRYDMCILFSIPSLTTCAGFTNYRSLMKLKEVVAGVWQDTMSGDARVHVILTDKRCNKIIWPLEEGKFTKSRLMRMP